MKNKKILVVLLSLIALFSSIGSVGAYMRKQTEIVENVLVPAEVSCEVVETFSDNKKTEILIKNTGDIEAYLRLRLVSYWVDSNGDILFKESPTLTVDFNSTYWIKSGDIYYYKEPIQPDESTKNLLNAGKSIQLGVDSEGNRQVVEVFAEAIQSKPEEAVENSWKVTVTDRNITSVN